LADRDDHYPDDIPENPFGDDEGYDPDILQQLDDLDDDEVQRILEAEYEREFDDFQWYEDQEEQASHDARKVVFQRYFIFSITVVLAGLLTGLGFANGVSYWNQFAAMVLSLAMVYVASFPVVMYFAALAKWTRCFLCLILTMAATLGIASSVFSSVQLHPDVGVGDALYFSIVTWTTLGFGDIQPDSAMAKWMAATLATTGYVQLGALITLFGEFLGKSPYKNRDGGSNFS
jgi:Ion channel